MLSEADYQEKLHFALSVFDTDSRGELEATEFDSFMKAFLSLLIKENQNEFDITFAQGLKRFWKKMTSIKQKNSSTRFDDLKKELMTDPFIRYCQVKGIFTESDENSREILTIPIRKHAESLGSLRFSILGRSSILNRSQTMYLRSTKSPKPTVSYAETSKHIERKGFALHAIDAFSGLNSPEVLSERIDSPDLQDNVEGKDLATDHQGSNSPGMCLRADPEYQKNPNRATLSSVDGDQLKVKNFSQIKLQADQETQDPKAHLSLSCKAAFSAGQNFVSSQTDLNNTTMENTNKSIRLNEFYVSIPNDDCNISEDRGLDNGIAEPMKPDHDLVCVLNLSENRSANSLILQGIDRRSSATNTERSFLEIRGSIQVFQNQMREVQIGCSTRVCPRIEPDDPSETSRFANCNSVSRDSIKPKARKGTLDSQFENSDGYPDIPNVQSSFFFL